VESAAHVGSLVDSGDVNWFIWNHARRLNGGVVGFDGRRYQPYKAAILLVSNEEFSSMLASDLDDWAQIRAGGSAIATAYLLAQLECLFRLHSRYLSQDGTVVRDVPKQISLKFGQPVPKIGRRVNRIEQSFALYLYRNHSELARRLRPLDRQLGLTSRLGMVRNTVMHGEAGDYGVEASFLALLCAMFYYEQPDS
jgi:hypothetical protein